MHSAAMPSLKEAAVISLAPSLLWCGHLACTGPSVQAGSLHHNLALATQHWASSLHFRSRLVACATIAKILCVRRSLFCLAMWPCVLAALACALCAGGETPPEPPFERGADLIRLELLAAHTGLCALSVAAHPDDEDGATLAWLRRMGGVEVHLCLATRGEGGQNESGPELGAELALKRTRETESAAR